MENVVPAVEISRFGVVADPITKLGGATVQVIFRLSSVGVVGPFPHVRVRVPLPCTGPPSGVKGGRQKLVDCPAVIVFVVSHAPPVKASTVTWNCWIVRPFCAMPSVRFCRSLAVLMVTLGGIVTVWSIAASVIVDVPPGRDTLR